MALTQPVIDTLVTSFKRDAERARTLYSRIAINGAMRSEDAAFVILLNPDRRDAAQFIFFEIAARFESFCVDAFMTEVRYEYDVQPQRAQYIMGTIDRGLAGVMGWASPSSLQNRARALFGKSGFFGRLETRLGTTAYQRLAYAHKVRNRVAHSGGSASKEFNKILSNLRVPERSRSGLSVGRLLMDYPSSVSDEDRWFWRFVAVYELLADQFHEYMQLDS